VCHSVPTAAEENTKNQHLSNQKHEGIHSPESKAKQSKAKQSKAKQSKAKHSLLVSE